MITTGREGEREWGYDYWFMPVAPHPAYREILRPTWLGWLTNWIPTKTDWMQ
jgi:hypothetical protein